MAAVLLACGPHCYISYFDVSCYKVQLLSHMNGISRALDTIMKLRSRKRPFVTFRAKKKKVPLIRCSKLGSVYRLKFRKSIFLNPLK